MRRQGGVGRHHSKGDKRTGEEKREDIYIERAYLLNSTGGCRLAGEKGGLNGIDRHSG